MTNLKNPKNEFTDIRSIYACRSEREKHIVLLLS